MSEFYALIVGSVPPSAKIIAHAPKEGISGDLELTGREFCAAHLAHWLERNPLGEFEEGIVVKVEPEGDLPEKRER